MYKRQILADGAKYHFEVPQVLPGSQGDFYIELICSQVRLTHWDEFFECSRQFTVDKIDWDLMQDGDVDSALLIAESIAEQSPESLEIIAEYMACLLYTSDRHLPESLHKHTDV